VTWFLLWIIYRYIQNLWSGESQKQVSALDGRVKPEVDLNNTSQDREWSTPWCSSQDFFTKAFVLAKFHKVSLYSRESYLELQDKYCLPCAGFHVHRTHTKEFYVGTMHWSSSKSYKDYENYIKMYLSLLFWYSDQQMHNYFTNYHTPTCFDTIVSSPGSW